MKMIRKLLLLIIFLLLYPILVFGSGQKDKSIIVPGNTVALARIDVQMNLNTGSAPLLLDLFFTFRDRGLLKKPGKTVLDEQLTGMFGIGLADIETVTLSMLSFSMSDQSFPSAVHMKLKQGKSKEALQHIKNTYSPDKGNYKGKTYLIFQRSRRKACFYTAGEDLLYSRDPSVMESMLDVLYGSDSVQDNKILYPLIKEYMENSFYCAGYVPGDSDITIPYPFEQIKEFGLTIVLDKGFSFLLKARADSKESAEELITAVKGNLALAGMLMLTQNKKAYPVLSAIIQGIEYEQKGSHVFISGDFTEKDLQNLLDMAPILFQLMK